MDTGPDSVVAYETPTSSALPQARPGDDVIGEEVANVHRLETAYARALDRAMRQNGRDQIATAFDEADHLQRRLLMASRRMQRLREGDAERTLPPGPHIPPDAAA